MRIRENQVQGGICSPKVNSKAQLLTSSNSRPAVGGWIGAGHLNEHRRPTGRDIYQNPLRDVHWPVGQKVLSLDILPDVVENLLDSVM